MGWKLALVFRFSPGIALASAGAGGIPCAVAIWDNVVGGG